MAQVFCAPCISWPYYSSRERAKAHEFDVRVKTSNSGSIVLPYRSDSPLGEALLSGYKTGHHNTSRERPDSTSLFGPLIDLVRLGKPCRATMKQNIMMLCESLRMIRFALGL